MKNRCLFGVCAFFAASLISVSLSAQTGTSTNPYNVLPTRILGQPRATPVTNANPNYVQGEELYAPQSVAYDKTSSPPILYVADTFNNRILAWKNPLNAANGAQADLVIGQLDFFSTIPQGPNQATSLRLSEGVSLPVAMTVDAAGNLYVDDANNNRILRYPRPFDQSSSILQADLVIGQHSLLSGTQPNLGFNVPSASTLALAGNRAGLAFDAAGALWISDPGNNRVMRFPASQLQPFTQDPVADLVLGQADFATGKPATNTLGALVKNALFLPSGIVFDASGRLYVCDSLARVTVWTPPFTTAMSASRVLGYVPVLNTPTNATTLGIASSQGTASPEGVFTIGNNLFVVDTPNSRILRYDTPDQWPAETKDVPSPAAIQVVGQADFTGNQDNRGSRSDATNSSLAQPIQAVYTGTDVWVADAGNNRVLGFQVSGNTISSAGKLFGQGDFWQKGINRVGQNGFYFASGNSTAGGSVAVDYNSNPPRLYLADPGNNRVLGYPDARSVNAGDSAAIVIGQVDFQHATLNYPSGNSFLTTDSGLSIPAGVAVDSQGNLWVADSGNGRVVRFPRPFDHTVGAQHADLVLGQASLYTQPQLDQATSTQMANPWGIAFLADGSVFVSDATNNRVLLFRKPASRDFQSGQAAAGVYGQRDFVTKASGNTLDKLSSPRFISTDTDDRLYVADTGNNRVAIYRQQSTQQPSGFPATVTIDGLSGPIGVTVSPITGKIWVANTNGNAVIRYPRFAEYQLDTTVQPDLLFAVNPLYVALDPNDNPIVTEAINRISLYYPQLFFQNAASLSTRALAPGMIAEVYFNQGAFSQSSASATDSPWPTTLNDIQVIVSGTPAALTQVDPLKIRFQVPQNVPIGQADFVVTKASTNQVLASGTFATDIAAPAFFVVGTQGGGDIVALNEDGSMNGPNNGAARGSTISLFGTGIGLVPNMPPDGVAPTADLPSADNIQVLLFGGVVAQADLAKTVKFFGLASGKVGQFRLDVVVPSSALPLTKNPVAFSFKDLASSQSVNGTKVVTSVYVK